MNIEVFIDGSSKGNPGPGKAIAYIDRLNDDFLPHEVTITKSFLNTTNNQSEYQGLLLALNWVENILFDLVKNNIKQIIIYTDSKLIAGHVNNGWKVNVNRALVLRSKRKLNEIKKQIKIDVAWIPREENQAGMILEAELNG